MPYIARKDRGVLDGTVYTLARQIETEGELNYVLSRLIHRIIEVPDFNYKQNFYLKYNSLNTIIGVLECVKQEFYRTVVAPYEDKKRAENGPVSSLDA